MKLTITYIEKAMRFEIHWIYKLLLSGNSLTYIDLNAFKCYNTIEIFTFEWCQYYYIYL